jgi:hypothetical protein
LKSNVNLEKNAFEKYLPAVMEDRSARTQKVIVESAISHITGEIF